MKTEIVKITDAGRSSDVFRRAGEIIRGGGLVVFPTETVYGLGADATNPAAAEKIYRAKGRPSDNPLIMHIADPHDAEKYTCTNGLYYKLAESFMPGPLTVIMEARQTVPEEVRASLPTVAVRCPSSEIAHALISASGVPIAAPSANLSGTPSPTCARHVIDDMDGRVDMIIDGGDCDIGVESTIVQITGEDSMLLLRPGRITPDELSSFGRLDIAAAVTSELKEGEKPLSPGMKYKHYAPKTEFVLLDGSREARLKFLAGNSSNTAVICDYCDKAEISSLIPESNIFVWGRSDNSAEHAHNLFRILRDADKLGFDRIYAPMPDTDGVGLALYNRMLRASANKIIKLD